MFILNRKKNYDIYFCKFCIVWLALEIQTILKEYIYFITILRWKYPQNTRENNNCENLEKKNSKALENIKYKK